MNRPQNAHLQPQNTKTKERRQEIARMGGIASGESRRKRKTLREITELILSCRVTDQDKLARVYSLTGKPNEKVTNDMLLVTSLIESGLDGNIQAIKLIAELTGELVNKVEISPPPIDETAKMIDEYIANQRALSA